MNVGKTGYFAVGLYWAYSDPGRPKIRLNNKVKNCFFIIRAICAAYSSRIEIEQFHGFTAVDLDIEH